MAKKQQPGRAGRSYPTVRGGLLTQHGNGPKGIELDTPEWFAWLADAAQRNQGFSYQGLFGVPMTCRPLRRGSSGPYWYGFAWDRERGQTVQLYIGKTENVTDALLSQRAEDLERKIQAAQRAQRKGRK